MENERPNSNNILRSARSGIVNLYNRITSTSTERRQRNIDTDAIIGVDIDGMIREITQNLQPLFIERDPHRDLLSERDPNWMAEFIIPRSIMINREIMNLMNRIPGLAEDYQTILDPVRRNRQRRDSMQENAPPSYEESSENTPPDYEEFMTDANSNMSDDNPPSYEDVISEPNVRFTETTSMSSETSRGTGR